MKCSERMLVSDIQGKTYFTFSSEVHSAIAATEVTSLDVQSKQSKASTSYVAPVYQGTIVLDQTGRYIYDISREDGLFDWGKLVGSDPMNSIAETHGDATVSASLWKMTLCGAVGSLFNIVRVKKGRNLIAAYNVCCCPFGIRTICAVQVVKTFDVTNANQSYTYENDRKWVCPDFKDVEITKQCRMAPKDYDLREWTDKFNALEGFFTKDFSGTADLSSIKVKC
jgi:hypothetical protein